MSVRLHTKPDLRALDQDFDAFLDAVQFGIEHGELTPEKRAERRAEADADDLAFCRIYFPRIFTHPFNALHRRLAALTQGRYSVSGFPQSGKSAFTYVGKALKHIALGGGGIVAVCLRTQDKAEARTASLSRILSRNRLLCYDYDLKVVQDRSGYHIFRSEGGTTHLVAGSVNTGLRSIVDDDFKRIRLAVADDLYDRETVRSDLDNERVYAWITGELWRQMEDDGLCIVLGNSISDGCPVSRLRRDYPDRHFSFPIRTPDGRSAWPERYSDEDLDRLEAETPFDVWHGEYLDDPVEHGEIFRPEWLRTCPVDPSRILVSITAIDPSSGLSESASYKSAFTLSLLDSHEVVCTALYLRREPFPAFFDYLDGVHARIPRHRVFLWENDFNQWGFAQPYYMGWVERTGRVLPIQMHLASKMRTTWRGPDKGSRILNLLHPHQTGLFYYSDAVAGTRDYELYRKQLLSFGAHGRRKLDGPDAAATAYVMIRAYLDPGFVRPLGRRRRARPSWSSFH